MTTTEQPQQAAAWYYLENDEPSGPVNWQRLNDLSKVRLVNDDCLVRHETSNDWIRFADAMDVPACNGDIFTATSPSQLKGWFDRPVYPWRRYGARILDTIIHGVFGMMAIGYTWFSFAPFSADRFFDLLDSKRGFIIDLVVTGVVAAVIGGVVVGSTGSSIGKMIFGIRVMNTNAQTIGIGKGLIREFMVFSIGMGFSIPIVSLITMTIANRRLVKGGTTIWDKGRNAVFYRPSGTVQTRLNVLGVVLIIAGLIALKQLNAE